MGENESYDAFETQEVFRSFVFYFPTSNDIVLEPIEDFETFLEGG